MDLNTIEVNASAEKDTEIFQFKEIYLQVKADIPEDKLQLLVMQAKKYCFVSNTIIEGCPITITTKSIIQ